jgi:predicted DsbA family dithiol-disulfide isomerase
VPDGRLAVIADYVCPYCYLAEPAIVRLREAGVAVQTVAFELWPQGVQLPSADAAWIAEGWERSVAPLARELGVTLRRPALLTRTRKAHEAVACARAEGAEAAMREAVYRAYWQDGRDIGRIDVLVDIGAGIGLGRGALRVALDIDRWTDRVLGDLAWARGHGVRAVPAYLLDRAGASPAGTLPLAGELRVGLRRYNELRSWVMGE